MTVIQDRWWFMELAAEPYSLEICYGGWGPEQELGLIELGERVMDAETDWLLTSIYSSERDRIWAAVGSMYRMVIDAARRNRPEAEQVLRALAGTVQEVRLDEIPDGWHPDVLAWDERRFP